MTIVNVTPDSFFSASRTNAAAEIESRMVASERDGASIIDIGGYSSRPGADDISPDEEWTRVARALEVARRVVPDMTISLDTFRSYVARRAVEEFGAMIINDISAGEIDPEIQDVAAEYKLPYIAMHMRGVPGTMQGLTDYTDVVAQVRDYFVEKIAALKAKGVEQIVIDPGFGFAKSLEQNYTLLGSLSELKELGCPILSALSRKSMIYKLLATTSEEALAGTIALGWESLRQGATILRVHDTREAVETIKIFKALEQNRR
ncbi:MAG: dihydropteroate synthase [Rikenellaceae bacterium]